MKILLKPFSNLLLLSVLFLSNFSLAGGDHSPEHSAEHKHHDQSEHFDNRVRLSDQMAATAGITTQVAGAGVIEKQLTLYGKIITDPASLSHIRARFPGAITKVYVNIGERVKAGQVLAEIESNESLRVYQVTAPFDGVIIERHANPGEIALQQVLLSLASYKQVAADLKVFQGQQNKIKVGQKVEMLSSSAKAISSVHHLIPEHSGQSYLVAHVELENANLDALDWVPGMPVKSNVTINRQAVDLTVDNRALQTFREQTVVFIKQGNDYHSRPVELGISDGKFTQILSGLNAGDEYVVENAYLLKADLEKSGTSHSH